MEGTDGRCDDGGHEKAFSTTRLGGKHPVPAPPPEIIIVRRLRSEESDRCTVGTEFDSGRTNRQEITIAEICGNNIT